jgi:TRAP-type C4-dicarboxylate transport system permease small subunit
MSLRLKKMSVILTHLVSMGLFGVMVVYGYQFAYFVRLQISPALQIPKWMVLCIIPVSGAILIFHAFTFLVQALKGDFHDH